MTDKQIDVGDVVAWESVPSGALVRDEDGADIGTMALRDADSGGSIVWHVSVGRWKRAGRWSPWETWWSGRAQRVTIVALGLTGQESAADLQRLAEVFEVREALDGLLTCQHCDNEEPTVGELEDGSISQPWCAECDSEMGDPGFADEAERLHAAGWRPGMTAEDAARLLSK